MSVVEVALLVGRVLLIREVVQFTNSNHPSSLIGSNNGVLLWLIEEVLVEPQASRADGSCRAENEH